MLAVAVAAGPGAARTAPADTEPTKTDDGGPNEVGPPEETRDEDDFRPVEWGPKGLDIRSRDGNYHAHIDWRAQVRFTESVFGAEGLAPDPESREDQFVVNRARFKLGGHAYRPWLIYYLEFDFVTPALLDLRFTLKPSDAFQFRFGL